MANFTAVLAAETARIAHGKGREVVVQNEALGVFTAGVGVKVLSFFQRSQRGKGHGHGFAAGEEGGTVNDGRQAVDFRRQGTQLLEFAAVGTLVLFHDGNAEGLFLDVFKYLLHVKVRGFRMAFLDGGFHFVAQGTHLLLAFHLAVGVNGVFNAVSGDFIADFQQFRLGDNQFIGALGLAGHAGQFFLRFAKLGNVFLGKAESLHEFFFRQLIRGAFNHDHVFLVAHVHQVQGAFLALGIGGVDDELAIDFTDAHGAHGALERNVGHAEGGRSAVDAENVGIVFTVCGEQDGDHLGIVKIAFGEKGAQRTVRHATGQDFLFRGTAFALEVAAGEHARRSGFFLVFHGPGGRRSGLPSPWWR